MQVTERRRERNVDSCISFFSMFGFWEHKTLSSQHTGPKLYQIWTIVAMVLDKSGLVWCRITRLQVDAKLSMLCACVFTNNTFHFNLLNCIFIRQTKTKNCTKTNQFILICCVGALTLFWKQTYKFSLYFSWSYLDPRDFFTLAFHISALILSCLLCDYKGWSDFL